MVSGAVFPEVGASGDPVNIKSSLAGTIPDPVEADVNHLRPFMLDFIVFKTHCCSVIYLHGIG